jgi:hypothetical protein
MINERKKDIWRFWGDAEKEVASEGGAFVKRGFAFRAVLQFDTTTIITTSQKACEPEIVMQLLISSASRQDVW